MGDQTSMKCLFVGGIADGRCIDVPDRAQFWRASGDVPAAGGSPMDLNYKVQDYERVTIQYGRSRHDVFTPMGTTVDPIALLIHRYPKPKRR